MDRETAERILAPFMFDLEAIVDESFQELYGAYWVDGSSRLRLVR